MYSYRYGMRVDDGEVVWYEAKEGLCEALQACVDNFCVVDYLCTFPDYSWSRSAEGQWQQGKGFERVQTFAVRMVAVE